MNFTEHHFFTEKERSLIKSEIEYLIQIFAEQNKLLLPCFLDYHFFFQQDPAKRCIEYKIVFLARPKTPDDILREQLEFQIEQLQS